jgi:hypothetical protein
MKRNLASSSQLALAIAFTLSAALGAGAAAAGECKADATDHIDFLRSLTDAAEYMSKRAEKDIAGLRLKLDAAEAKLLQWKGADAIQKLEDYRAAVESMLTAAKPKTELLDGYFDGPLVDEYGNDGIDDRVQEAELTIGCIDARM